MERSPCHIAILTRFCCRSFFNTGSRYADTSIDPLSEGNLRYRMRLLELFCLPTVLGQECQEFDWIILVDKDLPSIYQEQLRQIASRRARTYIQTHPDEQFPHSLDWCRRYIPPETQWFVSANLDDDDLLPRDYVEKLLALVRLQARQADPPLYRVFGVSRIVFWDLHFSPLAPLGHIAPYHRSARFASCGFGLIAKYPEMNYNVLGLSHVAPNWFQSVRKVPAAKFERFSEEINRLATLGLLDKDQLGGDEYSCSLDTDKPIVMTNHRRNVQWCRALEFKPGMRLTRPADLAPYALDLDDLQRSRDLFRVCLERQLRFYRWKPYQLLANLLTFPLVVLRTFLRRNQN